MARERRRLLIEPHRLTEGDCGIVTLLPPESHYLERVLRLREGDRLEIVDGGGRLWTAQQAGSGRIRLEQEIACPLRCEPAPLPALRLALGIPRREVDTIWRMATELGADRLQPLLAERSVVGERAPLLRWRAIVREAMEQCERLWLPGLEEPLRAIDWLTVPPPGLGLLATTRTDGLPLLVDLLDDLPDDAPDEVSAGLHRSAGPQLAAEVWLAIGPEGGWSPAEEAGAVQAGWRRVSLGGAILRTATAAVSGLTLLTSWRDRRLSASFRAPSP